MGFPGTFTRSKSQWVSRPFKLALVAVTVAVVSSTHKRIEGRAPLWSSEFTTKAAPIQGGQNNLLIGST
jgi:hypothetical protein